MLSSVNPHNSAKLNSRSPQSSKFSYLYSSNPTTSTFRFSESLSAKHSLISPKKFDGKQIGFFLDQNQDPIIRCDNTDYHSLRELRGKVKFPTTLNPEDLEAIATIANFLARGLDCTYQPGTAMLEGQVLMFVVMEGSHRFKVTLSDYMEKDDIDYTIDNT